MSHGDVVEIISLLDSDDDESSNGSKLTISSDSEESQSQSESQETTTSTSSEEGSDIIPSPLQFGFLGIGGIGSRFVRSLLQSGHSVSVWNRTLGKCDRLKQAGAVVLNSPMEVVTAADITFSCVESEEAVLEVIYGEDGAIHAIRSKKGFVEMSSVSESASKKVYTSILSSGGRYLEARILGGFKDIVEGSLMILACGNKTLMEECSSCFDSCSRKSLYFGMEIGKASKMHTIYRSMLGVTLGAAAEAMVVAHNSGFNVHEMKKILKMCPLASPFLVAKMKKALERNFKPDMTLKYLKNDVKLAWDLADSYNQVVRVTPAFYEVLKQPHQKR